MLFRGNIFDELNRAFVNTLCRSEAARLNMHEEFAVFYNNDYESICSYLREATLNNPFSAGTLKTLRFRHVNVIKKIISRITSGIFTKDPVIKLETDDASQQKAFNSILLESQFIKKVKDAFSKAIFFNTVEAQVIWMPEKKNIRIDILTPNNYVVETGNDYLQKTSIAVRKADSDGEIYWSYWNNKEHYLMKEGGRVPAAGNEDMINPFFSANPLDNDALPFSALRMEEGDDYFGEPNWNIFLHQKNLDIRLTDLNETELKTLHQIYLGINTNFTQDETFRAGDFKQINNVKDEDKIPSIQSITSNADYGSVRENIDWHNRLVLSSEGLNGGSASTELKAESGAAKIIDELELLEKREEYKTILYHFMLETLQKIIMVWNCYNPGKKIDMYAGFNIRFNDNKIFESQDEKIKRYEMGLKFGYKDEVDIAMEELEVTETEAIEKMKICRIRKRQLEVAG
jgi:hypothetical protein